MRSQDNYINCKRAKDASGSHALHHPGFNPIRRHDTLVRQMEVLFKEANSQIRTETRNWSASTIPRPDIDAMSDIGSRIFLDLTVLTVHSIRGGRTT